MRPTGRRGWLTGRFVCLQHQASYDRYGLPAGDGPGALPVFRLSKEADQIIVDLSAPVRDGSETIVGGQHEADAPEADGLARPYDGFGDTIVVDSGAVGAVEVLDDDRVLTGDDLSMGPGDGMVADNEVASFGPPHDVGIARNQIPRSVDNRGIDAD